MWQAIIVGLIVLAAAAYALWALLPAVLRLRLARQFVAWITRPGRPAALRRLAAATERAARVRLGGCSDCGAVQAAPKAPEDRPGH